MGQIEKYANCNGFNLYELNEEFAELLHKHKDDTEVDGESRKDWLDICEDTDSDSDMSDSDKQGLKSWWANIMNAYDELCQKHEGLRGTFGWCCGAEWTEYAVNPWDVYVGDVEDADPKRL